MNEESLVKSKVLPRGWGSLRARRAPEFPRMKIKIKFAFRYADNENLIEREAEIRMNTKRAPSSEVKKSKEIFESKELDKKHYCDSKILAQVFGVSVRRIQQLTQDGVIETIDTEYGKKYDLFPTILHFAKYQSDKLKNKGGSKREEDLKLLKLEAEIALKESQGELHRYKSDIAFGKYIEVSTIQQDYERFLDIFKKFALSLPSKVSNKLNGFLEPLQIRHIEKEIKDEVVKQLTGFVIAATVDREE